MTIKRLWQSGAEWNNASAEFTSVFDSNFTTSNAQVKTGTYAFRTEGRSYGTVDLSYCVNIDEYVSYPVTYTQIRMGFWVKHAGATGGTSPRLVSLRNFADSDVLQVRWDVDNTELEIYSGVGGTLLDSAASATFAAGGWLHIGLDIKFAVAGWAYLYVNGTELLAYDGDTTESGTDCTQVLFGGVQTSGNDWSQYLYFDDIYIDSTTGETIPQLAPKYMYVLKYPTGQGVWDYWMGSDGDNVDNWQLVDDIPSDGDTSYIEGDITSDTDSSTLNSVSVAGYGVPAVYPHAIAKRGADATNELKLYIGDTSTLSSGTSNNAPLTTQYRLHFHRRPTSINTSAWDQTELDNLEVGVKFT